MYFKLVNDSEKKPCARYCDVNQINRASISIDNKSGYKVRFRGDILVGGGLSTGEIELECNTSSNPKYMSTLPSKPSAICIRDSSNSVNWEKNNNVVVINNDCWVAKNCSYSSLLTGEQNQIPFPQQSSASLSTLLNWYLDNQKTALGTIVDGYWFPVSKYIDYEHRNEIRHGSSYTVNKCGYCKIECWILATYKWCYHRKILESYSCNDGLWNFVWNDSDILSDKSCDGDGWDFWHHVGDWGGDWHPANKHLGDCKESISETSDFNFTSN